MLKFGMDGSCGSGTFEADPATVIDSVRLSSSSTEFLFTEADIVNCADAGEARAGNRKQKKAKETNIGTCRLRRHVPSLVTLICITNPLQAVPDVSVFSGRAS